MARIVMKFGGTSVADIARIRNVARHVKREVDAGHEVAVVVSAMAGKTNELVAWTREASPMHDAREYDAVVAMYHDQGHIPVKLLGFDVDPATGEWKALSGVNVTLGLPIIRTSVDHGTAFDIAGKGIANEESLIEAIDFAVRLASGRSARGPSTAETSVSLNANG